MIQLMIVFIVAIAFLVLLTVQYRWPPFIALCVAALVVGIGMQMPIETMMVTIKTGLGNTLQSIGLLIVLGTILGGLLEHSQATTVMANVILKWVGELRAPLAMSLTGFLVGLPIFCDSGYIVLSGINQSLARKKTMSMLVLAVCLSTGLLAVHALVPPHPGITAAAVALQVDLGNLLWMGILVAIPTMFVAYFWGCYAAKKWDDVALKQQVPDTSSTALKQPYPSVLMAFLPIIVPILLIAGRSIMLTYGKNIQLPTFIIWLGMPELALLVGILLALYSALQNNKAKIPVILQTAVEKAAGIILITAAGGAFGAILAAANINQYATFLPMQQMGIFFPFLIAVLLKTAQGSTTVAVITSASIVLPFLKVLGLSSGNGPAFSVLAMGAGSLIVSHPNDSYFWVVAKFSSVEMKPMLRGFTIATFFMGLMAFGMIYILTIIM
jgi:GntP family gluconate:H+ symporter